MQGKGQQHYESLEVSSSLIPSKPRLVLVDDFVTKGRTLTAACSRISEKFTGVEVKAFAMVRTRGFDEINSNIDPFEGSITFVGSDANRGD